MYRVILLHFSGSVTEQFELFGMRHQVVTFQNRPSFNDLVARARAVMNVGCDVCLHRRYDMGDNRPIYVMLPLRSEDEWLLYKSCASESGLKGSEVVVEIALLPSGEIIVQETDVTTEEIIVDPIAVEQASQEELNGATHGVSLGSELEKTNSEALNLVVVTDEFDDETFDENADTEVHVEEDDEEGISELFIHHAGFLSLVRLINRGLPLMDAAVLTTLMDRWHPETHMFHLPSGEIIVTLQDVDMILGLPINDTPICGMVSSTGWRDPSDRPSAFDPLTSQGIRRIGR
jgi:hypothetical protein